QVGRLQRLINLRLAPTPPLRLDGLFGPLTHEAVLQYQMGVAIAVDGIVGRRTWYHLLKGDQAVALRAAPSTTPPQIAPRPAPSGSIPDSVWDWPFEEKLVAVLERVPTRLPERAKMSSRRCFTWKAWHRPSQLFAALLCSAAVLPWFWASWPWAL